MRLALEPEAAGLAALRRTDAQLEALFGWVEKMGEARDSAMDFVNSDLQFHIAVAEASGNPFMRSISALIEVALVTTFTISSPIPNSESHIRSVARHQAIAVAIRDGDVEAAKAAMRVVIGEGAERVLVVRRSGDFRRRCNDSQHMGDAHMSNDHWHDCYAWCRTTHNASHQPKQPRHCASIGPLQRRNLQLYRLLNFQRIA